jgi:hypothetical protein
LHISLELLNVGHALSADDVAVLAEAIKATGCKVDNDKVNSALENYRGRIKSPGSTLSASPKLAPKDPLQDHPEVMRARVEAGIFMLNEVFPNDIIVCLQMCY